jgi:hypothetical protein
MLIWKLHSSQLGARECLFLHCKRLEHQYRCQGASGPMHVLSERRRKINRGKFRKKFCGALEIDLDFSNSIFGARGRCRTPALGDRRTEQGAK